MAAQLSAEEMRKERERLRKRKNGILKKAEQFRRVSEVDIAVFVYDRSAKEYHTYRSNDDESWPPPMAQIRQEAIPSENLLPSDFTTDDDSDIQKESPRKKIPDIRLKTSPKKPKRNKGIRKHTRETRSAQRNPISAERESSPRSTVPPPPRLPSFIQDLARKHHQNVVSELPRPMAIQPVTTDDHGF